MTRMQRSSLTSILAGAAFAGLLAGCVASGEADARSVVAPPVAVAPPLTYVDLVDLARASDVVARVVVDDQITVPLERAPGLAPGQARLYVEVSTQALLGGRSALGESLKFLVDVPANARGKPINIKRQSFLIFGRTVPGRPGELQLAGIKGLQPATPPLEERVRTVLTQLADGPRRPDVTGIREVMSVPGNLASESETQIFLSTQGGEPVSLTVVRRPGMAPEWGVSWSEIVDQAASAPQPETIEWYTLACSLPADLPGSAFLQRDAESRRRAMADYQLILAELGPCTRAV